MIQIPVTIKSTGRPFQVAFPVDTTDAELAEAAGWMLTSLLEHFRAARAQAAPASRLVVPGPGVRLG